MTEVPPEQLRPLCDPADFNFETTAMLQPYSGLIGQDRAVDAIKLGLAMHGLGFNICVSGEPGTGRTTAIRGYLEGVARTRPCPDEWCYVNNFADPYRPKALRLPAGRGAKFASDMAAMIEEAKTRIPHTFAADDVVKRREEIVTSVQRHHETVFSNLADQARKNGFQLQGNPAGFFLVPMVGEEPMDDRAFAALAQEVREALLSRRDELMEELRAVMKEEQGFELQANHRLADLRRTIATGAVTSLTDQLLAGCQDLPDVLAYLNDVRREMIDHVEDFLPRPDAPTQVNPFWPPQGRDAVSPLRRYQVNLLVDYAQEQCASVVFESNCTPPRLFGRIEKEAFFGALNTDFTMLRAGSLHQANGGYLVFDFDELLLYPMSWLELKRVIRTGQITIEEMGDRLGFIETKTIRPETIPWTGKIVAIAREEVYRALYALDPDFRELFKVKADFDSHIDRTPANELAYAGLIAAVTRKEGLLPLDRSAVARIVEEGMRLAEDHNKLSIRFGDLMDVVREAAYWAGEQNQRAVSAEHVRHAIAERERRVNLPEVHLQEAIDKEIILVDTQGTAVGQVNGLSVIDLGDNAFGQPSRITATAGVGREGVIDLQRQARLSGPIHSKAVLTMQGFLNDRYAGEAPLTLSARTSFEQSYGMIEGDSATVAETCALLSRLADVPIKQCFAVTGSMNQRGEVQAIGGANYKIEGFFDVCKSRDLTGEQGVIIPASNVQHLMLREDVVQAVREGKFHVYSIETIDEALALLTGLEPGRRGTDGSYPQPSINGRVEARLREFSERLRESSEAHGGHAGGSHGTDWEGDIDD